MTRSVKLLLSPLILLFILQLPIGVFANNVTQKTVENKTQSENQPIKQTNTTNEIKSNTNTDTLTIHINDKMLPLADVPKNSTFSVEINTSTGTYEVKDNNKKPAASTSEINIFGTYIPIALVSAGISTFVTFFIYFLNRKNAKNQIKFDLALKNLLPEVYVPLITELREHELNNKEIDFYKVKKLIFENMVMLEFAPDRLRKEINELYKICDQIRSPKVYSSKELELVTLLKEIEKNITKRFGALKG
jgi:hypothetical protein